MAAPLVESDGPICLVFRKSNNELTDPTPWGLVPEEVVIFKYFP